MGQLKMLRFSLGVTRMDKIKNEFIRGTAQVRQIGNKVREVRLRWYGHVQRRNTEYICKGMLCLELSGKGEKEDQRRGSWMWQERTYKWLECQIGIRRTGEIGDCRSAVATPNGSSERKRRFLRHLGI